jgi:poly(3-hydroxybutyrate) depolymerase
MNVMLRKTATLSVAALLLLGLFCVASFADVVTQSYSGRDMLVHVPTKMAPQGQRALVVVLHGGLGSAERIADAKSEAGMNLNDAADKNGFVVAYLNGTSIARMLPGTMRGWNAGACCGQPAQTDVDDVGYIAGAVKNLEQQYNIAPGRAFAVGHSNGAMMALRMMCETHVFAAAVSISGALETDDAQCPAASGARILAIHGVDDANVPVAGGVGPRGLSHVNFRSEDYTTKVFRSSGAHYDLKLVPGADHVMSNIDAALQKQDGLSLQDETVRFFGIGTP